MTVDAAAKSLESYARFPLLFGPSPIQPLRRLTKHLGGATLWAKRDDCNSGLAFGGNKMRKLEYLVADALAPGLRHPRLDRRRPVEPHPPGRGRGPRDGHEVRARAGELGRLARRDLRPRRQHPPEPAHGRRRAAREGRLRDRLKESWEQALAEIEAAGGKPYAIPAGASDHPLGGLGFASWAREVEAQEAELDVFFDTIIVCSVTGSTQAGMIAGFADRAGERRVIGIDASAKPDETRAQVARIARFTAKAIGLGRDLRDNEIILDDRYHAGVYGIPDASTLEPNVLDEGSARRGRRTPRGYSRRDDGPSVRRRCTHRVARDLADNRAPWAGYDRGTSALDRRGRNVWPLLQDRSHVSVIDRVLDLYHVASDS